MTMVPVMVIPVMMVPMVMVAVTVVVAMMAVVRLFYDAGRAAMSGCIAHRHGSSLRCKGAHSQQNGAD